MGGTREKGTVKNSVPHFLHSVKTSKADRRGRRKVRKIPFDT